MRKFIVTTVCGTLILFWCFAFLIHSTKKNKPPEINPLPAASNQQSEVSGSGSDPVNQTKKSPLSLSGDDAYYHDGTMSAKWEFDSDITKGLLSAFYPDGSKWVELRFQKGKPHGAFTYYYPNGSTFQKGVYKEGQPEGERITYYENGQEWIREVYAYGLLQGIPQIFSESGQEEQLYKTDSQKETGYFKAYNADGSLATSWNSQGGVIETMIQSRFVSGQISSEWPVKGEKLNGEVKIYYPDGTLLKTAVYKEGVAQNPGKTYHANSSVWIERSFDDEGKMKNTRFFYPTGFELFKIYHQNIEAKYYPRLNSEIKVSAEIVNP